MQTKIFPIFVLFVMSCVGHRKLSVATATEPHCANGLVATQARQTFASYVSGDSHGASLARERLRLPRLPADSVSIVTVDSVCAMASARHARVAYADSIAVPTISLVRVGATRFVVEDGESRAGEYSLYYVYDSDWNLVTVLTH